MHIHKTILIKLSELSIHPTASWMLAFSGGLDSMVLLHALHQLAQQGLLPQTQVITAVFNQDLTHPDINQMTAFVHKICQNYNIKLRLTQTHIDVSKGNLEAQDRNARYQAFANKLSPGVLLTAHHLDDNIETFFIHLFRGSGLNGLSAIPAVRSFKQLIICRPLLETSQQDLESYAQTYRLEYWDDCDNHSDRFLRNQIRQTLMPALQSIAPQYRDTITRSIHQIEKVKALMEKQACDFIQALPNTSAKTLPLSEFLETEPSKQAFILRQFLKMNTIPMPSHKRLKEILRQLNDAADDKQPEIKHASYRLKRYRKTLYLIHESHWERTKQLTIPYSLFMLKSNHVVSISCLMYHLSIQSFTSLLRDFYISDLSQSNSKTKFLFNQTRYSLKTLMRILQIPPWERASTPLIFSHQGDLIAIGEHINPSFQADVMIELINSIDQSAQ